MKEFAKECLTFSKTKSTMVIGHEGGKQMARTGRPKAEKPINRSVTVKFKEEEYQIMLEYAENHDISISQLIRMGVELKMKSTPKS